MIDAGDLPIALNRLDYFSATMNMWDRSWSFGSLMATQVAELPLASLGAFTQLLGLSLLDFENFVFYLWFTGSGLSMFYMSRTFGLRKSVSLFSGAFYMLNPFSLIIIWQVGQGQLQIPYLTAPLALAAYHDFLKSGNLRKFLTTLILWIGIGGTSSFINPAYGVIIGIPIAFLFLSTWLSSRLRGSTGETRLIVLRSLKGLVLFALANLFWIIPTITTVSYQYNSLLSYQPVFGSLYQAYSLNSANLLDAMRLLGYWALGQSAIYGPYYEWGAVYFTWPFVAISFLIPLLVGVSLSQSVSRSRLFFASLSMVGLFLVNGTNFPFGGINRYLFETFFFFKAFQETFQRFGFLLALSFAPLAGEGLMILHTALIKFVRSYSLSHRSLGVALPTVSTGCIVALVLIVLVFPFWTGAVIQPVVSQSRSPRIQIPDDYDQLRTITASATLGERIISLPLSSSYNIALDWPGGGYEGTDPTLWFSSIPVIMINQNDFTSLLKDAQIGQYGVEAFAKLLAMSGVRYIVFHNDANFTIISGSKTAGEAYQNELNSTLRHFPVVNRFPNLTIYSNPEFHPYNLFYVPDQLFAGNITSRSILDVLPLSLPGSTLATITCTYVDETCNVPGTSYIEVSPTSNHYYVPTSGNYSVLRSDYGLLSNLSDAYLWRADQRAADNFAISQNDSTTSFRSIRWTVDRTVTGMRGVNFPVSSGILGNLTEFYIWVKGDSSGNRLTIQIYDTAGNYIAFPQTIDWPGWKVLTLPLKFPSYSGGPSSFDISNLYSITYYYENLNPSNGESVFYLSPPETRTWQSSPPTRLSQGYYNMTAPFDALLLAQKNDSTPRPLVSITPDGSNRYIVNVSDSGGRIPLVFTESFDHGWKACFGNISDLQVSYSNCLPESSHFLANNYANGWIVDKSGSFQLTVFYSPDRLFHLSLAVSVVSWVLLTGLVAVPIVRRRIRL